MITSLHSLHTPSPDHLHATFITLMAKVELHAKIQFRYIECPGKRADKVAECVALSWKWLVRLHERGKDVSQFTMVFVYLVVRAVKCGRRVTGQEKASEVMSEGCQWRHGFKVESLPSSMSRSQEHLYTEPHGQRKHDLWEERLHDNTITPVPDQVAFRIDFRSWLQTLTPRERRLIQEMSQGERTKDLSHMFEVSPGRISQLRNEFKHGWERYCGDHVEQSGARA